MVTVSHRSSYGIIETALEEQCNLIVLGRARRGSLLERLAATVVDRVVRSSPAQVIEVAADIWPKKLKSVMLAFEAGPHSDLTVDLAGALATNAEGKLRAVHVLASEANDTQVEVARHEMDEALGRVKPRPDIRVVRSPEIVGGLLREARGADLLVIGGTEAGVLEHVMGYALPLELADRTKKPVIIVYEMPAEPKRWLA